MAAPSARPRPVAIEPDRALRPERHGPQCPTPGPSREKILYGCRSRGSWSRLVNRLVGSSSLCSSGSRGHVDSRTRTLEVLAEGQRPFHAKSVWSDLRLLHRFATFATFATLPTAIASTNSITIARPVSPSMSAVVRVAKSFEMLWHVGPCHKEVLLPLVAHLHTDPRYQVTSRGAAD